jgi:uncharacterized membrane protein YkoI
MLLMGAVAQADTDKKDHDRARQLREAGVIVAVEPLVAEAKRRLPGRLLEIEFEDENDGKYVYEIELVDHKGVVREYFFDAKTGRFLKEGIHWSSKTGEVEGERQ